MYHNYLVPFRLFHYSNIAKQSSILLPRLWYTFSETNNSIISISSFEFTLFDTRGISFARIKPIEVYKTGQRSLMQSNKQDEKPDFKGDNDSNDEIKPLDTTFGKLMRLLGIQVFVHKKSNISPDLESLLKNMRKDKFDSSQKDEGKRKSEESEESKRQPKQPLGFKQPKLPNWLVVILSSVCVFYLFSTTVSQFREAYGPKEISFQEFLHSEAFRQGMVEKCVVSPDKSRVFVFLKQDASLIYTSSPSDSSKPVPSIGTPYGQYVFTIGSIESFEKQLDSVQSKLPREGDSTEYQHIPIIYKTHSPSLMSNTIELLLTILPFALLLLLFRSGSMLMGRGSSGPLANIFSVGKSKAKLYNTETLVKTTFKDVAGMDESKEELVEFVKFLKEPKVYEGLGAKIPKGAILSGPPGTGKTLLAKAIAGEAGVPFLSVSGSEFVEMFVGVGSSRVRDLFQEAKKLSPCIVFIDEIDAIGRTRGRASIGGNDERESTLNQLLVEMDGFDTDHHVVVLAGTNRPDILDPALTRPGRFDRQISIDKPDVQGRKDIYIVHLKPIKMDPKGPSREEIATKLAYMTPGFAGADIANVCNEGALIAARWNSSFVTDNHLEAAVERVLAGIEKKSRVLSMEEKNIVAHHEAGHATVAWFLKHADPVMKVTIIPRTSGALGFARTLPSDNYLISREQLMDRTCVTLGGRVAEEIFFGEITSGAQNDLQKVTKWAYDYVSVLGMDEKVGPLSFPQEESMMRGFGNESSRKYSESTAKLIDERVQTFIMDAYNRTKEVLSKHKEEASRLAQLLLQKETVHREELEKVLGARPFPSKHSYDEFIEKEKLRNSSTTH